MLNQGMEKEIITYSLAKKEGLKRYFTAVPCKYGHTAERFVSSQCCVECSKEKYRKHYHSNPEKMRSRSSIWDKKNPDLSKARFLRWKNKNSDHNKKRVKAWKDSNPEKWRSLKSNRRALEKKAIGKHTHLEIIDLYKNQNGRCAAPSCRIILGLRYHIDHIMPLSRSGSNDISNIQLLCPPCNHRKSDKLPSEWIG
jgi:5-methylcytosine-specific restriction endonuclease McrA